MEKDRLLQSSQSDYSGDELPEVDSGYFNPFVYQRNMTTYERVKIVLMCLLLVPLIRLLLIFVLFIPIVLLAVIGTLGHVSVDPDTGKDLPLSPIRRFILYPMRWFMRAILFVLGFYWIPVTYPKEPESQTARIIVANHVTFIDGIFFVAHCFPSVAMKADLGNIPLIGRVVRALDPILIDRKTATGRHAALNRIHDRPASGTFPDLLIFPEGTTSCQTNLTKFKRGPFTPGLPVQPVVLQYPHQHFDLSWPPTVSASYLFIRLLCQVHQQLQVVYLPVYVPSKAECENADLFAENVRQQMAKAMNVSCTNHAFEDVMLLMEIGEYADHVLQNTNVEEIRKLTCMRADEVERLVKHFAANDTNRDGKISYLEMKAILRQGDSDFIQRLFTLMDNDGNGQIDFRELCLGLSVLSPNVTRDDRINFAFSLYDTDGTQAISKLQLRKVLELSRRLSGLPTAQVDKLVEDFDTTKDGKITLKEFRVMANARPEVLDAVFDQFNILSQRKSFVQ